MFARYRCFLQRIRVGGDGVHTMCTMVGWKLSFRMSLVQLVEE